MGWIKILGSDTYKFYSLADSIENIYYMFFDFWTHLSPGVLVLMLVIFVCLIAVGIVWSIYNSVRESGVVNV